jgi:hypothetical protein
MGTPAREGCGRCHNFFSNKMIVEKGHERGKFIGFKKGDREMYGERKEREDLPPKT